MFTCTTTCYNRKASSSNNGRMHQPTDKVSTCTLCYIFCILGISPIKTCLLVARPEPIMLPHLHIRAFWHPPIKQCIVMQIRMSIIGSGLLVANHIFSHFETCSLFRGLSNFVITHTCACTHTSKLHVRSTNASKG